MLGVKNPVRVITRTGITVFYYLSIGVANAIRLCLLLRMKGGRAKV